MVLENSVSNRKKNFSWNVPEQKDPPNDTTRQPLLKRIINRILQRRSIAALLGFMCTAVMHSHRLNISIAMVAMVNNTSIKSANENNTATEECPAYYADVTSHDQSRREFEWSPELQGYILSAGYLGYFLTQIPGGIFAKKYGSKISLVSGLFIASACNLLSPLAARGNPYIFMFLTLIRGMAQGIKQPALVVLMSKWFPKAERGVLCSLIYSGYPIGVVITGLAGGSLCDLEFLGGWPLIFYVFGLTSTALAVIFLIFYHDSPEEDPRISDAELKHIQSNIEKSDCNKSYPIPWMKMLLSIPTLVVVTATFGIHWMHFYTISVHPIYLGTILNLPIKENGILSATPFLLTAIGGWLTSYFYYYYGNKKIRVRTFRKGINSFSCLLFIVGMLGVYFSNCNIVLNEVFSHVAILGVGFTSGGCLIAPVDMSPTFCGPLSAFTSTIASLAGSVATIVAGKLTNEEQSLSQWGKVFLCCIGVCSVSGLVFQLFGQAEIQPYDPASIKCSEDRKTEHKGEESDRETTSARF